MELLEKPIIELNTIDDELDISLEISDEKPRHFRECDLFEKLNKYKNMIDNLENTKSWDFYKKLSNEFELLHHSNKNNNYNIGIANYDPISRAFFKMWELVKDFKLIDHDKTNIIYGAIAEGPGGFIECFNYIRRKYSINRDDWVKCITLKSFNNDIPGWKKSQRIFRECSNYEISYGSDNTGDIYKLDNILEYAKLFDNKKADIVTADGGFDFSDDYENQEVNVFQLILCETICGLNIINIGGHMIIKIFDIFTNASIDLIYILCRYFEKVYIVKPFTSRSANSEKYIVCKGFKGISSNQLAKLNNIINDMLLIKTQNKYIDKLLNNTVPDSFRDIIQSMNIYFISQQIKSLIKGLCFVKDKLSNEDITNIKKEQIVYSVSWCNKYDFPINYRCKYLNKKYFYNFIPNY